LPQVWVGWNAVKLKARQRQVMTSIAVKVRLHKSKRRESLGDTLASADILVYSPSGAHTFLTESAELTLTRSVMAPRVKAGPVDEVVGCL
jgi:accessory colonization factor AcfC